MGRLGRIVFRLGGGIRFIRIRMMGSLYLLKYRIRVGVHLDLLRGDEVSCFVYCFFLFIIVGVIVGLHWHLLLAASPHLRLSPPLPSALYSLRTAYACMIRTSFLRLGMMHVLIKNGKAESRIDW